MLWREGETRDVKRLAIEGSGISVRAAFEVVRWPVEAGWRHSDFV